MEQFLEQWNKIPLGGKFLLVVLAWGAIGAGYYFTVFEDQQLQYQGLANRFRDVRKKRQKHQTIANNLPRWEAEVGRLRDELAKAQTLLPTKKEIPSLLRKIDDLGNKSGLKLIRFSPKNELPQSFYSSLPMQMEVNGTFYELMVFFDKVSNLDRIINVSGIKLARPVFKNQKLLLVAQFRLTTYRFLAPNQRKKKRRRRRQ